MEEGGLPFDDKEERFGGEAGQRSQVVDGPDRPPRGGASLERALLEQLERFPGAVGEAEEGVGDGRVEPGCHREEFRADAVPGVGRVTVRFVEARFEAEFAAYRSGVVAADAEQGAEERAARGSRDGGSGEHAAHAADAAPAQQVEEDRLGLVVGSVAGDDRVAPFFFGGEGEELVAHEPGRFLDAAALAGGHLADGAFAGNRLEAEGGGMVADELEVIGGTGTQLVVEVGDLEFEAERFAEGEQKMEAGEGIGAAGNGDEEAATAAEEALSAGEPFDGAEDAADRGRERIGSALRGGSARKGGPGAGEGFVSAGRAAATRGRRAAVLRRPAG